MGWQELLFVVSWRDQGGRAAVSPTNMGVCPERGGALEGLALWPESHTCHFCSHSLVGTNHKAPANHMGQEKRKHKSTMSLGGRELRIFGKLCCCRHSRHTGPGARRLLSSPKSSTLSSVSMPGLAPLLSTLTPSIGLVLNLMGTGPINAASEYTRHYMFLFNNYNTPKPFK